MKNHKSFVLQIFRNVIEIRVHKEDFRELNIRYIFERYIYAMPDICETYDACFNRLKKEAKWPHTNYQLHERARGASIAILGIMYEKRGQLNKN